MKKQDTPRDVPPLSPEDAVRLNVTVDEGGAEDEPVYRCTMAHLSDVQSAADMVRALCSAQPNVWFRYTLDGRSCRWRRLRVENRP